MSRGSERERVKQSERGLIEREKGREERGFGGGGGVRDGSIL